MRILYAGQLGVGETALERMHILEAIGHCVLPFDTTAFLRSGCRLERSVAHRANTGRPVGALNHALRSFARERPYDVAWIDKGTWVFPETVAILREHSDRRFVVHYTPDAQLLNHRSRHFFRAIPFYDLLVTTKPFEAHLYRQHGARRLELVLQGFGRHFRPRRTTVAEARAYQSDVAFVGHYERHYAGRLRALSSRDVRLSIWGPRWPRYAALHPWSSKHVQGDGLWGDCYPVALASAKIALGLLTKHIPETTTTRTFEIPATGTFLLAERTDDHRALFEEGCEAEFFGCDDELRDKARFYLTNEAARERIAWAGRARCLRSGYGAEHQMRRILAAVG